MRETLLTTFEQRLTNAPGILFKQLRCTVFAINFLSKSKNFKF